MRRLSSRLMGHSTRSTLRRALNRFERLEDRNLLAAGDLDTTFGLGGKVTTTFPGSLGQDYANDVAIQADGRIVVVGESTSAAGSTDSDFAIVRYNSDGTLDNSFGNSGLVLTDFGSGGTFGQDSAWAVAIQADQRIVVLGYSSLGGNPNNFDFVLACYESNGALDTTFGVGGKVRTDFGNRGANDFAHGIAIQDDGKIVVCGTSDSKSVAGYEFAIARYDAYGNLDPDFGSGGRVTTDFTLVQSDPALGGGGDRALEVEIQTDGKIVAFGDSNSFLVTHGQGATSGFGDFVGARYNPDGSLDTTFGSGGKVVTAVSPYEDAARTVAIQPDGKLVVASFANTIAGAAQGPGGELAIVRYLSNGNLDSSFGQGGIVRVSPAEIIASAPADAFARGHELAIQPNGKILLSSTLFLPDRRDFVVSRFNVDGTTDSSFGDNGHRLVQFQNGADYPSLALQTDGRIVAAGSTSFNNSDFAVARVEGLSPFVVDSTSDAVDAADGVTTLREAILNANAHPGVDTITFNIPGSGVQTIRPTSALPTISDNVLIDGYTQPGAATNTLTDGNNAILRIELDGSLAGHASGLFFHGPRATVRGLVINRFAVHGIHIGAFTEVNVLGCFIGTDPSGTIALGNARVGVGGGNLVDCDIGGTTPEARNLISGNGEDGIGLHGFNCTIQGNFIGTDVTGTKSLVNGHYGVYLTGGTDIVVGGTVPGARNVIVGNFNAMRLNGDDATVQGNYIGVDVTGLRSLNGAIEIRDGQNNLIGGSQHGMGNVIGSGPAGVTIMGVRAQGNIVQGNFIGVASDRVTPLPNRDGVFLAGTASNNLIGGTGPGEGNVIAFNTRTGVFQNRYHMAVPGTGNAILGNEIYANVGLAIDYEAGPIGSDPDGVTPNDPGDADTGVNNLQNFPVLTSVTSSGADTTIAGTLDSVPNSTFRIEFYANPMDRRDLETYLGATEVSTDGSGQASFNVTMTGRQSGYVFITATATRLIDHDNNPATAPIGETSEVSATAQVPGEAPVDRRSLLTTFVVTNTNDAGTGSLRQALLGANASPNWRAEDYIDFAILVGDSGHYYYQDDGVAGRVSRTNVLVTSAAMDSLIADIDPDWPHSWWSIAPISALPPITNNVVIDGYSQAGAVPNTLADGDNAVLRIELDGSSAGAASGLVFQHLRSPVQGLVINRFGVDGINIFVNTEVNVFGCFIGTDASGTIALGNQRNGIGGTGGPLVDSDIGGTTPEARNLISGNGENGIGLSGSNSTIQGNFIGTDVTGTKSLVNGHYGVYLGTGPLIVGGTAPGARNVIVGNFNAMRLDGYDVTVQGNYIGADVSGQRSLRGAIEIRDGQNNLIGGSQPGMGNVIGGGGFAGITILGPRAQGNIVQGNFIGVGTDGVTPLPNARGVFLAATASNNLIGGTAAGAGNVIAFNTLTGVFQNRYFMAEPGSANSILRNSIYANGQLGIDFNAETVGSDTPDGVTPNDPLDADIGVNNLQNYPELASASTGGGLTRVTGSLHSTANTTFRIEFFASSRFAMSSVTDREGERFLGFVNVTTDGSGNAPIDADALPPISSGDFVTATATDPAGNTSEFSAAIVANGLPTADPGGPYTVVQGGAVTLDATGTSDPDQSNTTLTYEWDFDGDGRYDDATGIAPMFSALGFEGPITLSVGLRVTDDGGLTDVATTSIDIVPFAIQPDPCDPTKTALVVGGTAAADTIVFSPGANSGDITVSLNGVSLGVFQPTGRLIAYGQAGNDDIQVAGSISLVAELHGQGDNDRLKGAAGNDLLFGEDGDDLLVGGQGRDLLIGGTGADRIVGNADDDILVAGTTAFDQNHDALCAIMNEWTSDRDYLTRRTNILGTGNGPRHNANYFLTTDGDEPTVYDDAAKDVMTGSEGQDWFFANLESGVLDKITDLNADEFQPDLQFILSE